MKYFLTVQGKDGSRWCFPIVGGSPALLKEWRDAGLSVDCGYAIPYWVAKCGLARPYMFLLDAWDGIKLWESK